jgi:hypothetical protein
MENLPITVRWSATSFVESENDFCTLGNSLQKIDIESKHSNRDRKCTVSQTPEEERFAARVFELRARILKDHGFDDTASLYDGVEILCKVKALVLEDIERRSADYRKAVTQTGIARA